jgi:hypothetical protein
MLVSRSVSVSKDNEAVVGPHSVLGIAFGTPNVRIDVATLIGVNVMAEHAFSQIFFHARPSQPCLDFLGKVSARFAEAPNERCRI